MPVWRPLNANQASVCASVFVCVCVCVTVCVCVCVCVGVCDRKFMSGPWHLLPETTYLTVIMDFLQSVKLFATEQLIEVFQML